MSLLYLQVMILRFVIRLSTSTDYYFIGCLCSTYPMSTQDHHTLYPSEALSAQAETQWLPDVWGDLDSPELTNQVSGQGQWPGTCV